MYTFAALRGQANCVLVSHVSTPVATIAHRQEAA